MNFDPNNNIVKLCAQGMSKEAEGNSSDAANLFLQAWADSTNDFEKFTSAHYVARHQKTIKDKLKWDETALHFALQIKDDDTKAIFPSLYLNIAKCYEDLNDFDSARKQYQLALSYLDFLRDDGYSKMIKSGIERGLERVSII
jgi:tetratricopeptide (TPR) repeat protein